MNSYNADDSISNVTDSRGAVRSIEYNSRGLVEEVSFSAPSGIEVPATSSFVYDNAGNRTQMTDGFGTVDYVYNSLSQITAETRDFIDSMANSPISGGKFKLEYEYQLGGQLSSYTDPFGQEITYSHDNSGRVNAVTGTSFGGVTSYANNPEYRAWGGLKEVDYASGIHLELGYNNRLQASSYDLETSGQTAIINKSFSYYTDGKLKYSQDHVNPIFDRLNTYNHRGFIKEGFSGGEARAETVAEANREFALPYKQTFAFDAFGHLTESNNMHWGVTYWQGQDFNQAYEFENNRVQLTGWTYDSDGRLTASGDKQNTHDAAGKLIRTLSTLVDSRTSYDGDGRETKRQSDIYSDETAVWTAQPTKYYIRSSVLQGRVISEVWANGKKHRSIIKGIGRQTAVQSAYASATATLNEFVLFEFSDSSGMSYRTVDKNGAAVAAGDGGEGSPIETDPLGGSIGTSTPYVEIIVPYEPDPEYLDLIPFGTGGPEVPGMDFASLYATFGSRIADLPGFGTNWGSFLHLAEALYEESVWNATHGLGFNPNEFYGGPPGARLRIEASTVSTSGGTGFGPDGIEGTDDDTVETVNDESETSYSISWDSSGGSDDAYHIITRRGTRFIAGAVQFFLDRNPDCEALYNKLLTQLSKDTGVRLEGDIRHFVREFGESGTLSALTFTPKAGIVNTYGAVNPFGPNYKEPGWGIELAVSTNYGTKTFESFGTTFLGELTHAIGIRDGKSKFTDEAGANAFANLGIGMGLDAYIALPEIQPFLTKDPALRRAHAASALMHGILGNTCAKLPGSGRFIGLR